MALSSPARLQLYQFKIEHRKGRANVNADFLFDALLRVSAVLWTGKELEGVKEKSNGAI